MRSPTFMRIGSLEVTNSDPLPNLVMLGIV
jgi:hypothetical protein